MYYRTNHDSAVSIASLRDCGILPVRCAACIIWCYFWNVLVFCLVLILVHLSQMPKCTIHCPSSVVRRLLSLKIHIFDFSSEIQQNLTRSKIWMSSTKFVFFGPIGKTRWPLLPLIGWDIFTFSSETSEWKLIKFDRKQDLNVLYQVCVFRTDLKNKIMASPAFILLRPFWLLVWNC